MRFRFYFRVDPASSTAAGLAEWLIALRKYSVPVYLPPPPAPGSAVPAPPAAAAKSADAKSVAPAPQHAGSGGAAAAAGGKPAPPSQPHPSAADDISPKNPLQSPLNAAAAAAHKQ